MFLEHFNDKPFYPLGITHSSSSLYLFTTIKVLAKGNIQKKCFFHHFTLDWCNSVTFRYASFTNHCNCFINTEFYLKTLYYCTSLRQLSRRSNYQQQQKDPNLMQLLKRLMIPSNTQIIHLYAKTHSRDN